MTISVRTRFRLVYAFLAVLATVAVALDVVATIGPSRAEARRAQPQMTPRQVLRAWFAAWNANDPRRVCSFYSEELLEGLGGGVEACAGSLGDLTPQLFQIASIERDADGYMAGVLAGTQGGAVFLALEDGEYKITGIRA